MFRDGDHSSVIRMNMINGWPRLPSERIRELLKEVRQGDPSVWDRVDVKIEVADNAEKKRANVDPVVG